MGKQIILALLSILVGFTLTTSLINKNKINEQNKLIEQLAQEIMLLKDDIYDLQEQLN